MDIEGQLMRGLFRHERLKPAILHMDKGNVRILLELKKVRTNNLKWPIVVIESSPLTLQESFIGRTKAK